MQQLPATRLDNCMQIQAATSYSTYYNHACHCFSRSGRSGVSGRSGRTYGYQDYQRGHDYYYPRRYYDYYNQYRAGGGGGGGGGGYSYYDQGRLRNISYAMDATKPVVSTRCTLTFVNSGVQLLRMTSFAADISCS